MTHLQRQDRRTYESRVKTYFAACRSVKKIPGKVQKNSSHNRMQHFADGSNRIEDGSLDVKN